MDVQDPVPHLPLQSMGFRHNPTEVFYDRRQKSYKICDGSGEDKSCSDKYLLPLNVVNHLNYLGFDFTTYVLRVSSSSCSSEGSLRCCKGAVSIHTLTVHSNYLGCKF